MGQVLTLNDQWSVISDYKHLTESVPVNNTLNSRRQLSTLVQYNYEKTHHKLQITYVFFTNQPRMINRKFSLVYINHCVTQRTPITCILFVFQ